MRGASNIAEEMVALRSDDREAFKQLFANNYQDVCRVIHRYIVDPGISEDLAQEVFIRLWNKRHDISIETNLPAYLRRMGVNEALAYLRKKTRFKADELPLHLPGKTAASADEQSDLHELQDRIAQALEKLPPRCRLVFELSRYEDLSNREIAEQLQLSIKTIENQMTKALKMLRSELADYLGLALFLLWING
ncbi:MAG: RNA polymerase sigma-70 factor [Bacteroidota bacterium]